jgi:hypothetical protein
MCGLFWSLFREKVVIRFESHLATLLSCLQFKGAPPAAETTTTTLFPVFPGIKSRLQSGSEKYLNKKSV